MAGVFPTIGSSRLFAFLLFVVLVWVSVDIGKLAAGLLPVHHSVKTLMDPNNNDQADKQAKL